GYRRWGAGSLAWRVPLPTSSPGPGLLSGRRLALMFAALGGPRIPTTGRPSPSAERARPSVYSSLPCPVQSEVAVFDNIQQILNPPGVRALGRAVLLEQEADLREDRLGASCVRDRPPQEILCWVAESTRHALLLLSRYVDTWEASGSGAREVEIHKEIRSGPEGP